MLSSVKKVLTYTQLWYVVCLKRRDMTVMRVLQCAVPGPTKQTRGSSQLDLMLFQIAAIYQSFKLPPVQVGPQLA